MWCPQCASILFKVKALRRYKFDRMVRVHMGLVILILFLSGASVIVASYFAFTFNLYWGIFDIRWSLSSLTSLFLLIQKNGYYRKRVEMYLWGTLQSTTALDSCFNSASLFGFSLTVSGGYR